MLRKPQLLKNSRGDTIVEVLLSIVVLSTVLTMSYNIANRNTNFIRASQERGEALKLSEAQLELLKAYDNRSTWSSPPAKICFRASDNAPTSSAAECNFGDSSRYSISITKNTNTYTVNTVWDSITGDGQDRITLSYRLY